MKLRNWIVALTVCLALFASACGKNENPPAETGGNIGTEKTGENPGVAKTEEEPGTEEAGTEPGTEEAGAEPGTEEAGAESGIAELVGTPSDYSKKENWMRIPEITHEVDTFYIYPTCYLDDSEDAKPICDIDNPKVQARAREVYGNQGTVYEDSTNVFVPYYRQSNIYQVSDMEYEELEEYQRNEQRTDIYAALDYYFEHYNEGRPFIIAGHSQGSIMTKIILGEYMQAHPEYYERMVAAYPIGFSITKDFLEAHPYLKFAEGADDTGVIVSWNTEGKGNKGQKNLVVEPNAISINPINWKRDDTYAGFEENLGSRIWNEEAGCYEVLQGIADAQVDTERGVVICTAENPNYAPAELFGPESLHGHDYDFYYENLKENVKTRVEAYLKQNGKPQA